MLTPLRTIAALALLSISIAAPSFAATASRAVTINAAVPGGSKTVYVAGNIPALGPWNPGKVAMTGSGRTRSTVLHVPAGTKLEFKFTEGSWQSVETTAKGADVPNRKYTVPASGTATYTGAVAGWHAAKK